MPVPTDIDDLSTDPALNDPPGSDAVFPGLDDHLRFGYSCIAQLRDSLAAFDDSTGAALIGFLQSGTGADARTLQSKGREWVSVEDFGATADNSTNSSASIEEAAAALSARGGGVLYFPPGTTGIYKCNNRLDLPYSNITYYGPGVTLDFSGLTEEDGGVKKFIKITGAGLGTAYALTSNAAAKRYTAVLSSGNGANFAAGDWTLLTAENAYPYAASTVKRGEIKQVQSVSSGTVTFRQANYDDYTTANTAQLRKVTFIENVHFHGFTIKGNNTEASENVGIEIEYVNGFSVKQCRFKDIDQEAVRVYYSIKGNISENDFDGVRYTGSGVLFYGIVLYNCVQWTRVTGNIGHELRHLVTTSASSTRYGEPYFCRIAENVMDNSMAGASLASWAYENHGFGRWITWADNQADSCHTGMNIERGDQIVKGNIFRNCRFNGILFSSDSRSLENITVANNVISGTTVDPDAPTGQARGISFESQASCVRKNIKIVNNQIVEWGDSGRTGNFGIRIEAGSGSAIGCEISGNTFDNALAFNSADFGVRIEQAGWIVKGNTTNNYERAFYLNANDIEMKGNTVYVATAAGTNRAVELRGNNINACANTFRGCYQAFFVASGSTACKIAGNDQYGTTVTTVSDSGTSTVLNYGAVSGF